MRAWSRASGQCQRVLMRVYVCFVFVCVRVCRRGVRVCNLFPPSLFLASRRMLWKLYGDRMYFHLPITNSIISNLRLFET